ncbi:MAG: Ig-like domain-containing protein, partial [Opitutae bacterium]|nr:Ig-like domain-containing protein [Opitutae bacterium]
ATLKNLTLNGKAGAIVVPPGTYGNFTANSGSGFVLGVAGATVPAVYNFQNLTLNGNSTFAVVGPVVVTIDEGFSTNSSMGASAHPEWFNLRIADGGLSVNGNATVYANLEAPDGTLTLNGNTRLVGAVATNRLTVNGNSLLQLVAPTTPNPNQSPAVALTSPADGTSYAAPTAIALAATATDSDGTVAKVEFFSEATNLGEDTTAPYELTWTPPASGIHVLTAKATDNAGAVTTSAPVTVTVADNGVPFLANFEPVEGYQLGSLNGQRGWNVLGTAEVVTAPVYFGQQAVSVAPGTPPALLTRTFVNADPGITFIDLFVQPAAGATPAAGVLFETDATRVALTGTAPAGILQAFNGDGVGGGTWSSTGKGPVLDADGRTTGWLRLTTRSDYATKKWDLYFNGQMIAADLGFVNSSSAAFTGLDLSGHSTLTTGFDDLLVAFDNPIFTDADHDGMDDAWETVHGLNATLNDRNGDLDQDGLTNIQEYVLGADPSNADSDGDGIPDKVEALAGTDPTTNDASADLDHDGVSNLIEYQQGRSLTKGAVPDSTGVINLRVFQPDR